MNKALSKTQIFWAPTLETARNIDDSDTVLAIEAERHRFSALLAVAAAQGAPVIGAGRVTGGVPKNP
jgi:hypothetical protein